MGAARRRGARAGSCPARLSGRGHPFLYLLTIILQTSSGHARLFNCRGVEGERGCFVQVILNEPRRVLLGGGSLCLALGALPGTTPRGRVSEQ